MPHFLIVSAHFYPDITSQLVEGAKKALYGAKATFEEAHVPGALEIAPAMRLALDSNRFDGFIALGCVIRGETSHYDTVCNESARGLTWLAIEHGVPVGNGILTVENEEQAHERADTKRGNKGGAAAEAALALYAVKERFTL